MMVGGNVRRVSVAVALALFAGSGTLSIQAAGNKCEPPDYDAPVVVVPTPPCTCSPGQVAELNRVIQLPYSLDASVPTDSPLDSYIAGADLVHSWKPVLPAKSVLCGCVDHTNYFGLEGDWNLFVVPPPGSSFAHDFEVAKALMDPENLGELRKCGAGSQVECMEVESAPYAGTGNEIPPVEHWFDPAKLLEVCAYGPLVQDLFHGGKPETHPADLFWWRNRPGDDLLYLMAVEDGDRFGKQEDFDPVPPDTWHPWAEDPRRAAFRIAFRLAPSDPSSSLTISEKAFFQVETERYLGPDPAAVHTLSSGGQVRVSVTKSFAEPKRLRVGFRDVCMNGAGELQGYVLLRTTVGRPEHINASNEYYRGYHVLGIASAPGGPAVACAAPGAVVRPVGAAEQASTVYPVVDVRPTATDAAYVRAKPALWAALLRAAGASEREAAASRPGTLRPVPRWSLRVTPRPEQAGFAAADEVMKRSPRATWALEAINLVTGRKVEVVTGEGAPNAAGSPIVMKLSPLDGVGDGLAEITFPGDLGESLYQVDVSVGLRVADQAAGRQARRFWSHVLPPAFGRTAVSGTLGLLQANRVLGAATTTREALTRTAAGDSAFKVESLLRSVVQQQERQSFLTVNDVGRLLRIAAIAKATRSSPAPR